MVVNGSLQQPKSFDFLAMHPFGQVPVIADDDIIVRDSQAILVYLAKNMGTGNGYRLMLQRLADVVAWKLPAMNTSSSKSGQFKANQTIRPKEVIV